MDYYFNVRDLPGVSCYCGDFLVRDGGERNNGGFEPMDECTSRVGVSIDGAKVTLSLLSDTPDIFVLFAS